MKLRRMDVAVDHEGITPFSLLCYKILARLDDRNMRIQAGSWGVYRKAHKNGKRSVRKMVRQGSDPYLLSLDSVVNDDMIADRVSLGVMDIPTEAIVGVATPDKRELYSHDFLPLSNPDTDFSTKWCKLYWYYLGNKGIRCPISCYEYMGKFYILDGIKRVSIATCHGVPTITASVVRLMPRETEKPEIQQYYEFLKAFEKTGLYQIEFSLPGSFDKFQQAMGFDLEHQWNEEDRLEFLFNWPLFKHAFEEAFGGYLKITPADAFLVLLEDHPFEKLREMSLIVLVQMMRKKWNRLYEIQKQQDGSAEAMPGKT